MNEVTTTEMLVRSQGASNRPAIPVSLRVEPVQKPSQSTRRRARLAYRRKYDEDYKARQREHAKRWYWRNRDAAVQKQRDRRRARGVPERKWRTPEEIKEWRKQWRARNVEKCKAYRRKWNQSNKEKVNAQQRRWRQKNIERARERDKKYRSKYTREQLRIAHRKFLANNPGYNAAYHRKEIENLADWYVRARMSRGTNIHPKAWPVELVELQKINIKLKRRLWHNQKTSTNSETNS